MRYVDPPINYPPIVCNEGQVVVVLERTCGIGSGQESFEIYEGNEDNLGNLVYNQTECNIMPIYLCMNPIIHTIILRDNNGDGWDSDSFLLLSNGSISTTFTLEHLCGNYGHSIMFNATTLEQIILTPTPPECGEGQILVEMKRTCRQYYWQESFEIFEGYQENLGNLVYNQTQCNIMPIYLCMNPIIHTIILRDSYGDGWESGSYLLLSHDNNNITFTLEHLDSNWIHSVMFNATTLELYIPPPPECEEGQILITMKRTCEIYYSYEESFEIYEGNEDNLGNLVYSQTQCAVFTTYLCMNPIIHTIILRDSRGNGWDYDSSLLLSNNNNNITFTLEHLDGNFGHSIMFNATTLEQITPNPPECGEGQILITLKRSCGFRYPYESFEIYEGNEDNLGNLVYSQTQCNIMPIYLCMNPIIHTIILRSDGDSAWFSSLLLSNDNNNITFTMDCLGSHYTQMFNATTLELYIPPPPECGEGQILIEMERTCWIAYSEESFEIYEGSEDNLGNLVYNQTQCAVFKKYLCMNPIIHTIILRDSRGDGWESGSYLLLSHDNNNITFILGIGNSISTH